MTVGSSLCVQYIYCIWSQYIKKEHEANMKQTHGLIIALLLCLLCCDASLDKPPEIIGPHKTRVKAPLGTSLVLRCRAKPNADIDETLIYWLVNGSFPEASKTSRISEMEESMSSDGTVQRSLMLRNITMEDSRSTFVCVVMNPLGVTKKHVKLLTSLHFLCRV